MAQVFECEICKKKLVATSIIRHKRTVHGEKGGKQYICKTCNKSLQTQARLIHHEKCHSGERPEKEFACEECKYTTMSKAYLKDHIRRMHVVRGVGWMCVEGACEKKPKTFVNNRLLLQHKKNLENLPCQECNKTFPSRRNLNRHRKRVHRQEQQNSDEDSINYVPAQQVDLQELMSLSTFNLEGAVVIPLELDPLTS